MPNFVVNELKLCHAAILVVLLQATVALLSVSSQNNDWLLGGHDWHCPRQSWSAWHCTSASQAGRTEKPELFLHERKRK